ncbi:integral membrane sensor signal transduction histidine kinase [Alkaliphilus metalliredigens QYMF]|uniref:histidine kinase n=1 Tax=Alkaliphilus metalliredigens (strain QYMF) TaxID=293826 RepID=A6TKJ7_ALKMQ|nr:ATP-binding protein [Alkaliphilus metalliredigens]ABR46715.1 integral membrane sensor signal transduction histidine kinase [Alkaliphilus metalliredigens QYMF]
MYPQLYKKISFLKEQSEIMKIIFLYRYVSLIVTSSFYLLADSTHSFENKIFIVACISISSVIISYLYIKNQNCTDKIMILILIETIGNSFILIPSGGLNSPYVWYSLNTIVIASVALHKKYCWINLVVYLFSSTYLSHLILQKEQTLMQIISEESNLILSFILITGIIQLLTKYAKRVQDEGLKLTETNRKLVLANKKNKESLGYIMELYEATQLFTTQETPSDLIELMLDYSQKVMKTDTVIFIHPRREGKKVVIESNNLAEDLEEVICCEISSIWHNTVESEIPIEMIIKDQKYVFIAIKYNYKVFGILGITRTSTKMQNNYEEITEQLRFLASLSSITLEKFELEKVTEGLLINEEQNRIANEIHDGILQRLFSTSCGVFSIVKRVREMNTDEIEEELNIIRRAVNNVMKDLRSTVYGLSWKKDGANNFISDIESYINEIKALNNIDIKFDLTGDDELLSIAQKKAMYRIICEGIGNAVRHGNAQNIEVSIISRRQGMSLIINDDGKGFNMRGIDKSERFGLGVKNIYHLTHSLNGTIKFESQIGKGTRINIVIPNVIQEMYKEEVV